MVESKKPTFADVLANRDPNRKGDLNVNWKTGKISCLNLVRRPEGCNDKHCEELQDRCQLEECMERLEKELSTTKVENERTATEFEEQFRSIAELLSDILVHCRTDDLDSPTMEESRLALKSARSLKVTPVFCQCAECQLGYVQKEAKMLKQKKVAVDNRVTILREYRRANDKEVLARTNSSYMKGGKYFTLVGGAKANGVKALRPTLQLQSSYDVVNLTTNSMEERPLIGMRSKKNKRKNRT